MTPGEEQADSSPVRPDAAESTRSGALAVVGLLVVAACLASVALVFSAPSPSDADLLLGNGDTTPHQLDHDGRTRTYLRYEPYDLPIEPVPLIIALHGVASNGRQFQLTSGLDEVAEVHGAIIVYPDGIDGDVQDRRSTWNGGDCCGDARKYGVDDVGFLRAIIETELAEQTIDPARIFVIGHSNGGMMTYRMACQSADVVTGVGVMSGSLGVDNCAPALPVSLMHVHGAVDRVVPPEGLSMGGGSYNTTFRPARLAALTIAVADGCASTPVTTVDPDDLIETWSPCNGDVEAELRIRAGKTHDYPGAGVSDEVFTFLSDHPRESTS